jgi:LmbE family N-acetylglucosaminyl deacetylase
MYSTDIDSTADDSVGRLVDRIGPAPMVLLAVWSHPDDESFLAGGLLSEVARRGGRVVTVAATWGEHGTSDPALHPPAELALLRGRELDEALGVLGAEPAIGLGFGDGTCDRVPERLGAAAVGSIIDRVRPDAVVTFGPDGVTGHPDHCAVGRWTRSAIADRGDRIALVTSAAQSAWPAQYIDRLHTIGAFWPGHPVSRADAADVVVRLGDEITDRKLAALGCHASQMGPVEGALGRDGYRLLASTEAYRAANAVARRRLTEGLTPIAA